MCDYLYCREPSVFGQVGADSVSVYACTLVLSTEQAVVVERLFREFVIEFV